MPRTGPDGPPVPTAGSDFATWAAWLDTRQAGLGEQWISWIQENSTTGQPVQLFSVTYGPPPHNTARDWLGAWLADAIVGPELGKVIGHGITAAAGKIPGALTGAAQGIGQVPAARTLGQLGSLTDFLARLSQAATWERVALAGLGIILLGIGAARITGTQNIISKTVKARIP